MDMMWCRLENTNIDRGEAEVNIGILWSTSHYDQYPNSQWNKKDNKQCLLDTPRTVIVNKKTTIKSILCMQSIRLFQQKLWYKSISPHMHYRSTKQTPLKI